MNASLTVNGAAGAIDRPVQTGHATFSVGPWPLILRELKAEARRHFQPWLRLLGAASLAVLMAAMLSDDSRLSASLSIRLFVSSHTVLICALAWIGPALTCDAIGREQRDGTLGLLFMTNLTSRAIVIGKGMVHMTRLFTLWLAGFPIVMVPILFGGVAHIDVLSALIFELTTGIWALAAGLAVSSCLRSPIAALLVAELLGTALLVFQIAVLGLATRFQLSPFLFQNSVPFTRFELFDAPLAIFMGMTPALGWSGYLRPAGSLGIAVWSGILWEIFLLSLLGFLALVSFATYHAGVAWMEKPPSARQQLRRDFWFTPRFWLGHFQSIRSRSLERNPLGWLHRYSARTRAINLGGCAAILLVESVLALSREPWKYYDLTQLWLAILLVLHMNWAAILIFRSERDSGVMELLLVTPIRPAAVIYRQVCGFWRRFAAPVALLIGLAWLMAWLDWATPGFFPIGCFVVANFVTIPFIGLYASARFVGIVPAFLLGIFVSLGLPLLSPELSGGLVDRIGGLNFWFLSRFPAPPNDSVELFWIVVALQGIVATALGVKTHGHLIRRTFVTLRSAF